MYRIKEIEMRSMLYLCECLFTISTPSDHQSALCVCPLLLTTSGAIYSTVPQKEYAFLSASTDSLLNPKSERHGHRARERGRESARERERERERERTITSHYNGEGKAQEDLEPINPKL